MGKPIAQSRSEILKCAAVCRYYADHAARILAHGTCRRPEPATRYVRWDPLGIVLGSDAVELSPSGRCSVFLRPL